MKGRKEKKYIKKKLIKKREKRYLNIINIQKNKKKIKIKIK